MSNLLVVFAIILITGFIQASKPEDDSYVVGLVEFGRKVYGEPKEKLEHNLKGYREVLNNYVKPNDEVDIIVFPEFQLNEAFDEITEFVPDPDERKILCDEKNNENFVSELSCWAAKYKKYIVVNMVEKANCTSNDKFCSKTGFYKFNTNVVFDRNGAVIARYRKHNLGDEFPIKPTDTPQLATFETDFGVTFGTFICFDIMFHEPAILLVNRNITDILYPTMWFSEMPFLTGNQLQFGWSYANDVNFLVSGGNFPKYGVTGTGAFGGKQGIIKAEMLGISKNQMIITKVPKKNRVNQKNQEINDKSEEDIKIPSPKPNRLNGFKSVIRDRTLDSFKTVDVNDLPQNIKETVCYNDFCCNFNIERVKFDSVEEGAISYNFKLGAFADKRDWYTYRDGWTKICTIFACTDKKNSSTCGTLFDDDVNVVNTHYFKNIEIDAEFNTVEKMLLIPTSIDQKITPLNVNSFDFNVSNNGQKTHVNMKLKQPNSDLLTFGIFGIYYDGFTEERKTP